MKASKLRTLRREISRAGWGRDWNLFRSLALGLVPDFVSNLLGGGDLVPPWVDGGFARRINLSDLVKENMPSKTYKSRYLRTQHHLAELRGRSAWVQWTNQAAPQHQVEMRHPFYDRRLVEFLLRIPPGQKLGRGATKSILRVAMRDILPESILFRGGKANFIPLFDCGLGDREMDRFRDMIGSGWLGKLGYIDSAGLLKSLQSYDRVGKRRKTFLFIAAVLEEWLGETIEGNGGDSSPLIAKQAQPSLLEKGGERE